MASGVAERQDKVLVEGWWSKKAGKGNINPLDRAKAHHRYYVLTERYLDWYEKPGYPRKGSVALDQIYVRKHGSGNSIVVGVVGGKEFKMTSEGKDPGGRVNDWYDRLTNQMDICKQRSHHNADRKQVINPGIDKPKEGGVTTQEINVNQPAPPPVMTPINTPGANFMAPAMSAPLSTTYASPPPAPTMTTQFYSAPTATYAVQSPPMMQTSYATYNPQPRQTIMCGVCRNQFQTPLGTPMARCPFCQHINSTGAHMTTMAPVMHIAPTPTYTTTTYAPAPYY